MKYKDAVKKSMEFLAQDSKIIFLGYNLKFGSKSYGTLADVSSEKILETPLAENLMAGLAIGMSLEGFLPLVFYERQDFLLNCLDAIVNHADKIEKLSHGQYKLPLIIRSIVGSNKPIDPGPTHTQDLSDAIKSMVNFPIYEPKTSKDVFEVYRNLIDIKNPVMVVERKSLYNLEI